MCTVLHKHIHVHVHMYMELYIYTCVISLTKNVCGVPLAQVLHAPRCDAQGASRSSRLQR